MEILGPLSFATLLAAQGSAVGALHEFDFEQNVDPKPTQPVLSSSWILNSFTATLAIAAPLTRRQRSFECDLPHSARMGTSANCCGEYDDRNAAQ
jgi:hypothetical protein